MKRLLTTDRGEKEDAGDIAVSPALMNGCGGIGSWCEADHRRGPKDAGQLSLTNQGAARGIVKVLNRVA